MWVLGPSVGTSLAGLKELFGTKGAGPFGIKLRRSEVGATIH